MKDYQGDIAVFKNYVDFHDSHSQLCPGIGENAIKELQELVDKEKPMEVNFHFCPVCGSEVYDDYCQHCGQHLDYKNALILTKKEVIDAIKKRMESDNNDKKKDAYDHGEINGLRYCLNLIVKLEEKK